MLASGEGGFNMCRNRELFYKLYSLRNCGRPYPADPPVFGLNKPASMDKYSLQSGNYRLTEWQAALLLGGLKRLAAQVKQRDTNAIYLNSLLEEIPGIQPMRRRKEVTQQSYFNFAFRLDTEDLKVNNKQFSVALNAELAMQDAFEPPYEPLNNCGLFRPQTKERHRLNAAYWKALDMSRYKVPVATDAHENSGVTIHHQLLMNSRSDMEMVASAIKKIVDNIDQLRAVKPGQLQKYQALSH